MSESNIVVQVDDRARLVMAALAASDWPEREQKQAPHAVHQHSKQTRQQVAYLHGHPAVELLNAALNRGVSLADLFSAALRCTWPELEPLETLPVSFEAGNWVRSLSSFHASAALGDFWLGHASPWIEAVAELKEVFQGSGIIPFLSRLSGRSVGQTVSVIPDIVYPMLSPVMATTTAGLFLVLPPAKAWGESPPWPFGEDPGWVIAQTCWHLAGSFMADSLSRMDETQRALLRHGTVALCLEQELDEAEAMAYMVRSKKEFGLPRLPAVVEQLRQHWAAPAGKSLVDLGF